MASIAETISFFSEGSFIPYHYESSLSSVGTSSSLGKRTRRLAQEIVTLSNSLPLSASSSVFVRASEERLDVMKVSTDVLHCAFWLLSLQFRYFIRDGLKMPVRARKEKTFNQHETFELTSKINTLTRFRKAAT